MLDPHPLSPRQRQVLVLANNGMTRAEISDALGISDATLRHHLENARQRLKARTTLHACVLFARQEIAPRAKR